MATDHITLTYATLRHERRPVGDSIRAWFWRNQDHVIACSASGALGLVLSGAFIASLIIHY